MVMGCASTYLIHAPDLYDLEYLRKSSNVGGVTSCSISEHEDLKLQESTAILDGDFSITQQCNVPVKLVVPMFPP